MQDKEVNMKRVEAKASISFPDPEETSLGTSSMQRCLEQALVTAPAAAQKRSWILCGYHTCQTPSNSSGKYRSAGPPPKRSQAVSMPSPSLDACAARGLGTAELRIPAKVNATARLVGCAADVTILSSHLWASDVPWSTHFGIVLGTDAVQQTCTLGQQCATQSLH